MNNNPRYMKNKRTGDVNIKITPLDSRPVSKTRAGGRIRSFGALVVAGDQYHGINLATAKRKDASSAIRKAEERAKMKLKAVPNFGGYTVSYDTSASFGATKVIIKQAKRGTGLIAGKVVKKILEAANFKDVVTKVIGNSSSPHNVAYATLKALRELETVHMIAKRLNKKTQEILDIKKRTIMSCGRKR